MSLQAQELVRKRNVLVEQGRDLLKRTIDDKRALSADEETQYSKIMDEVDSLKRSIDLIAAAPTVTDVPDYRHADTSAAADPEAEKRAAFTRFLRGDNLAEKESRHLQMAVDSDGGYLAPQAFYDQVFTKLNDAVWMRQLSTVVQVSGSDSLGVPAVDTDPADGDWTSEIGTISADSTMAIGKRDLKPHLLVKLVKASRKLVRTVTNAESLVAGRVAYKMAVSMEKGYLTGNGSGRPLGVFTASDSGISTGRDVITGSNTAYTFNGLLDLIYKVKEQYRRNGAFVGHRDSWKAISKLRSDSGAGAGTGEYLWQPSNQIGQPDRLKGFPVYESEYAPNTFTEGNYGLVFGDFSHYMIADSLQLEIQRLEELYAGTSQIGWISRAESDGMPIFEEAFARSLFDT